MTNVVNPFAPVSSDCALSCALCLAPFSVIRVDPASGFTSLCGYEIPRQYGFAVEVGRVKNPNKNPVAEKCVAELGDELLRICPEGGRITPLSP